MGTFDWNNDGKTDATDDFLFLEVISKDSSDDEAEEDEFPTLGNGSRNRRSTPQHTTSTPRRQSGSAIRIGKLTKLTMALTAFLCISALLMGYGNIIGDLFGIGFLVCLFTSWLESHP